MPRFVARTVHDALEAGPNVAISMDRMKAMPQRRSGVPIMVLVHAFASDSDSLVLVVNLPTRGLGSGARVKPCVDRVQSAHPLDLNAGHSGELKLHRFPVLA